MEVVERYKMRGKCGVTFSGTMLRFRENHVPKLVLAKMRFRKSR